LRLEYEPTDSLTPAEGETQKVQTPILYFSLLLAAGNSIVLNFSAAVEYESSSFTLNVDSEPDKPLTPLSLFGLMAGQTGFRIFLLLYNSTSTVLHSRDLIPAWILTTGLLLPAFPLLSAPMEPGRF
jgi:hypothetical protein